MSKIMSKLMSKPLEVTTFNIMFDDLKPEVQEALLDFLEVTEDEINKDIYVVAVIEKPEED